MIDFLIIGGGVAGTSAAFRLSSLGTVQLLERETGLAYHVSGRSAAMFEPNYGKPSVVALNKASFDYLRSCDGGVLRPRGILMIGTTANQSQFASDAASFEMDQISIDQAVDMVFLISAEGRIIEANKKACDLLGYSKQAIKTLKKLMQNLKTAMIQRHKPLKKKLMIKSYIQMFFK